MKIFFLIAIPFLLVSCFDQSDSLSSRFDLDGLKLSEVTKSSKESYKPIISRLTPNDKDTLISEYQIGKFRLTGLKIKNTRKNVSVKSHLENFNQSTSGQIFTGYELDIMYNVQISKSKEEISEIDFYSDIVLEKVIDNDSVKNFYIKADKFLIKLNSNSRYTILGYSEYEDISNIYFDVIFYQRNADMYIFIMNSNDINFPVKKGELNDYLFKNILPL